MLRSLFALIAFSSLSCATKPVEQPALQTVGIVSMFSDQLNVVTTPKLTGKEVTPGTKSWNINDAFVSAYSDQLKALNKNPIAIKLDDKTVTDMVNEARNLKDIYLGDRWQILTQYVLNEAEKQGAQYVIFAHPFSSKTYDTFPAGYGISCIAVNGKKGDSAAYFMMRAELYNVATKRIEASSTITPEQVSSVVAKQCVAPKTDKAVEPHKETFMGLVKKTAELNLEGLGISHPLMK